MAVLLAGEVVEDVARIAEIIFVVKCQLTDSGDAEDEFAEGVFQTAHFGGFSPEQSLFADRKEIKRQRRRGDNLFVSGVAVVEHPVSKC